MPRQRIPDFRCQVCPSIYLSQSGLDSHMEKEHGDQGGAATNVSTPDLPKYVPRNRSSTFNCSMCNYKYLEQSGLDKHMEKDHNAPPGLGAEMVSPMTMVMNRPAGGQLMDSPTSYTPRRRTQEFKCQYCNHESPSIYLTQSGLAKHVEKEHSNPQTKQVPDWKPVDITEIFQRSASNECDKFAAVTMPQETANIAKKYQKEEKGSKRKSKKEKDPNAPKRPLTAYFLFMADERGKVKISNPEFTVAEVGKELGERWKNLDTGKKEMYQEKATKERARYDAEMKEYTRRN